MKKNLKTHQYHWEGCNHQGKFIRGELEDINTATVRAKLRKQGIEPKKIRRISKPFFSNIVSKSIKPQDITFFLRQMAIMARSGVPLIQSFGIVGEGCDNLAVKKMIQKIHDIVSSGTNFSQALRKFPNEFDSLTCNLIESGEKSGALEEMLDRVALYREKTEQLRSKIKKAMLYPSITLAVALAVTVIMLVKVVPTFETMFSSYDAELPAATRIVINLSYFVQEYFLTGLIACFTLTIIISQLFKRSKNFRRGFDRLLLKIPVVGELISKGTVARYARVLSTTFAAGLPLIDALDTVAKALNNLIYRESVIKIRHEIAAGQQMNFAMRNTNIFPNMIIQMVTIGEESGNLDNMLEKAAVYYEDEVDSTVDNITTLIEPVMFVFLGVVLGGLLIAMYMPMFQMGEII